MYRYQKLLWNKLLLTVLFIDVIECKGMKISVVVPTYNEEDYIEGCLKALQNQTKKPFEIIVVDNNSTDRTSEIAKSYGAKVVKEKKKGVIFARNKGFDSAKGDIIARCDADSRPTPQWIEKIIYNFRNRPIDALTGPVITYDLPLRTPLFADAVAQGMRLLTGGKELTIGPNMAITKEIWKKIKNKVCLDSTLVHEDYDISLWIYTIGGHVYYDKTNIVLMSGRRIKQNPASFFIEYPIRAVKTLQYRRA